MNARELLIHLLQLDDYIIDLSEIKYGIYKF